MSQTPKQKRAILNPHRYKARKLCKTWQHALPQDLTYTVLVPLIHGDCC